MNRNSPEILAAQVPSPDNGEVQDDGYRQGVAHGIRAIGEEARNCITAIGLQAQFGLRRVDDPQKVTKFLQQIIEMVDSLEGRLHSAPQEVENGQADVVEHGGGIMLSTNPTFVKHQEITKSA